MKKKLNKKTIKVSRRKKVHLSDEDVKLLIKTIKTKPLCAHLVTRFKNEMKRRTGKVKTGFKGKYSKPLTVKP
jgi:hypothetical protein